MLIETKRKTLDNPRVHSRNIPQSRTIYIFMHSPRRNRPENLAKIEIRTLAQLLEKGTLHYKILMVASLHCTEQCSSQKKECNTLETVYARVNLSDVDGLECLAWAVYNGVYVPGDPLDLTGHHDWERIIVGTTLHLIFHRRTNDEHCKP